MNKAYILLQLKTKYSKLGLSEKTLSAMADKILSELGAEAKPDEVQTAVDGVEPFARMMQSEADTARTLARKEAKDKKPEGNEDAEGGDSEPGKKPEKPAGDTDNEVLKELRLLRTELNDIKQGKAKETRRDLYVRELEGLPEAIKTQSLNDFDRLSFKDDEDFTGWIEGKKTGFAELKEANDLNAAATFGRTPKPNGGTAGADKPSTAFKAFQEGREAKGKEINAKDPFS